MPKEPTLEIPTKELTKLLKAIKFYQRAAIGELGGEYAHDDFLDKSVTNFFHFQCGVKRENLTTGNVLSDKFKI